LRCVGNDRLMEVLGNWRGWLVVGGGHKDPQVAKPCALEGRNQAAVTFGASTTQKRLALDWRHGANGLMGRSGALCGSKQPRRCFDAEWRSSSGLHRAAEFGPGATSNGHLLDLLGATPLFALAFERLAA
jgi:hypothetical protein